MKKLLSTSLFSLIAVFALQSCEVSVGYDYGYPRHCGYNAYCGPHHGGRGWHRRPRHGGHHGYPGHHRFLEESIVANNTPDSASLLAADYGIKVSSAKKILAITTNSANRNEMIKKLRISQADVNAMAKLEMPSRKGVQNIANVLGERSAKIEKLLADFISDVKAE